MRYVVITVLLILTGCGNPDVEDATDAVRAELTDGPSAKFREVTPCPSSEGHYGQVSSINHNGMRTRFINFIYIDGEVALADNESEYADLRKTCVKKPRPQRPSQTSEL